MPGQQQSALSRYRLRASSLALFRRVIHKREILLYIVGLISAALQGIFLWRAFVILYISLSSFIGTLYLLGIVLYNQIIKAVTLIVPYTGSSTPIPEDILMTFQDSVSLYTSLYLVIAACNCVLVFSMTSCCSFGALYMTDRIRHLFFDTLMQNASLAAFQKYPLNYLTINSMRKISDKGLACDLLFW